jgi:hypothetical protein
MKSFRLYQLCIIVSITCNLACSQDDNNVVGLAKYESCCGTQPRNITVEGNSIYIPNVFTPNGDGINDYFMPTLQVSNDSVIKIGNFFIFDSLRNVMFYSQLLVENKEEYAWDGVINPNQFTSVHPYSGPHLGGSFDYEFQFTYKTSTGFETETVQGKACVIRCGADAAEFEEKTGCYFTSQGIGGVFNPNADRKEGACFK